MWEFLELDQKVWESIVRKAQAKSDGGLQEALCILGASRAYGSRYHDVVWKRLRALYKQPIHEITALEEFWVPQLEDAVRELAGEQALVDLKEMFEMKLDCQFSGSMWRRSYRTRDVGYHVNDFMGAIGSRVRWQGYGLPVEAALKQQHIWVHDYEWYLALEIRRGNQTVINGIREAMLGDNQQYVLTRSMIEAVIVSGHEELFALLLRLLDAARLQEGLRQQILESADAGRSETFVQILKFCIDRDMFRYSSAIRALDTWTGLGYGDAKPAAAKKCAALAYECLTDEAARTRYLKSTDTLEIYFAMWALGCRRVEDCEAAAEQLLQAPEKYKRAVGWYFVSHTEAPRYQMHHAAQHLGERDPALLAWVTANLAVTQRDISGLMNVGEDRLPCLPNAALPDDKSERQDLFAKLKEVVQFIGKRNTTFSGCPFAFNSVMLDGDRVLRCMASLVVYDRDEAMLGELMELRDFMDVDLRRMLYRGFLDPKNRRHRAFLWEGLQDRSLLVKESIVAILQDETLDLEDLEMLAGVLRSKSSALRKSVMTILREQDTAKLTPIIVGMLRSGEEHQIQAGIELLLEYKETAPALLAAQQEALAQLPQKLSTQTEILRKQLMADEAQCEVNDAKEKSFGLYSPAVLAAVKDAYATHFPTPKEALYKIEDLWQLVPTEEEHKKFLERINKVFARHADYEYETCSWDGSREKVLFGDLRCKVPIPAEFGYDIQARDLTMVPFHEDFLEAAGEYATDSQKMLGMALRLELGSTIYEPMSESYIAPWYRSFLTKLPQITPVSPAQYTNWMQAGRAEDIFSLIWQRTDTKTWMPELLKWYRSMLVIFGLDQLNRDYIAKDERMMYMASFKRCPMNDRYLSFWRDMLRRCAVSDEDFRQWFELEYALETHFEGIHVDHGLSEEELFRAADLGLVPRDVLTQRLLFPQGNDSILKWLTNPRPSRFMPRINIYEKYSWAKDYVSQIMQRVVEVEAKRGELATPLTPVAKLIQRVEGAVHFVRLLAALGKENFCRGYEYGGSGTKRDVLSHLLKNCYPAPEDTPEHLAACLKETDIKEKRLAEAVMYAPQWASLAEKALGWPGLKRGVWFFHAHINEQFSAEKETEAALYSPITPQQFNDGAFDKEWFLQAYKELGEKRFQVLYQSAKYITTGSNQHKRSQLYADAVLGRLSEAELKAEIVAKRNQERLRCYPLLPLPEDRTRAALDRYTFLRQFQKESKQFGAQRRESEKKACLIALDNLAITLGFVDTNRMIWFLESEQFEQIRPLLVPTQAGDYLLWLEIAADGTVEVAVEKDGRRLKSVPTALKKSELVMKLQATVKELKEQKRRGRESLEKAMVESAVFPVQELRNVLRNPVLAPMLRALVWTDGMHFGFLTDGGPAAAGVSLIDVRGEIVPAQAELRIAHPHDLLTAQEWASFMRLLFEEKRQQPFKQVFREYYPLTADERQERMISRRYAGHQVQTQKTAALLKGRGWTVDYEEGLQKVYYKENLVVRMYAMADWFSPADIEAPTLEEVRFFDRNTGDPVALEDVPPIVFSEVMRDLDLVVSVAHVGGVDPEASHSTVEMRAAIAAELTWLLKLQNVTFFETHAKIRGALGNYSVHLGSGIVHAEAKGMIAILPVHSQARGRIFLPFADDDPKTAEILSKIILLAEDHKIKDPSILSQL